MYIVQQGGKVYITLYEINGINVGKKPPQKTTTPPIYSNYMSNCIIVIFWIYCIVGYCITVNDHIYYNFKLNIQDYILVKERQFLPITRLSYLNMCLQLYEHYVLMFKDCISVKKYAMSIVSKSAGKTKKNE